MISCDTIWLEQDIEDTIKSYDDDDNDSVIDDNYSVHHSQYHSHDGRPSSSVPAADVVGVASQPLPAPSVRHVISPTGHVVGFAKDSFSFVNNSRVEKHCYFKIVSI